MARTLSSAVQTALGDTKQHVCHLLSFAVGPTTYRFAEDQVVFQGNTYKPHLTMESGVRYSEKLRNDPVTVKLQNIDLQTAAMLKTEGTNVQGQEATLQRLFLKANEAVILFKGRISEVELDERNATLTLAGELDPTASQVPKRKYSNLCVWDFKDSNCGYVNGVDPNDPETGLPFTACPKDLLSCQARGRQQRFPGFLTITRDLTEVVEGHAPDAEPNDRVLGDFNAWE